MSKAFSCLVLPDHNIRMINTILVHKEIINPLEITPPDKITKDHLHLLQTWASICNIVDKSVNGSDSGWGRRPGSIWASISASISGEIVTPVLDLVRKLIWDSIWSASWASGWEPNGYSARDAVWAYVGSFFKLPRKSWRFTDKIKTKGYPFQPAIDLWNTGLVPSFNIKEKVWRLHGGKEAKILWEGKI